MILMDSFPDFSRQKPLPFGERLERGFSFNSKLLLFGEYGMMFDAMALSVPFNRFSGYLDFDNDRSHQESSAEIHKFYEHLKAKNSSQIFHFPFDLENLRNDLQKGLYFKSNIPQQYGVGSSGALVAALFMRYAAASISENQLIPELLKADFALLESYFHRKSSGIDPLISFLNQPLLIDSKKMIRQVQIDFTQIGLSFALVDTGTTGATGPLVQHFIDMFMFPDFEKVFERQFVAANNGCIESLLDCNHPAFFLYLDQLIRFQLQYFRRMIPEKFQAVISEAPDKGVYIKLLGSGGGGFLLAIAASQNRLKQWAIEKEMLSSMLFVDPSELMGRSNKSPRSK
jgi:mevalonate kinase